MKLRYAIIFSILACVLVFPTFSQETAPLLNGRIDCGSALNDVVSARATYWFDKGVSISLFSTEKPLGRAFARIMLEMDKDRTEVTEIRLTYVCDDKMERLTAKKDDGKLDKILSSWKLENDTISLQTAGNAPSEKSGVQAEWDIRIKGLPVK